MRKLVPSLKNTASQSPHPYAALHAYFNQRLLKILTHYHKRMEGWDEILNPDLPRTIVIQSWRGQSCSAKPHNRGSMAFSPQVTIWI